MPPMALHSLSTQVSVPAYFAGPLADAPANFSCTADFACPDVARIMAGRAPASGHISGLAQDIWSLGCLFSWLLTLQGYFSTCGDVCVNTWLAVSKQHDIWVRLAQLSHTCGVSRLIEYRLVASLFAPYAHEGRSGCSCISPLFLLFVGQCIQV